MAEIFLWVDKIPGESLDAVGGGPPHIDDIELLEWQMGLGNGADHHRMTDAAKLQAHKAEANKQATNKQPTNAHAANRHEAKPEKVSDKTEVRELTVWKLIDLATKPLVQACAKGTVIEKATLTLRKSAGDYKFEYMVIDFFKLKVMGVYWEESEQEQKKEKVTFRFTTFKLRYTMQDNSGEGQGHFDFGWNQTDHAVL
jgi:type VI protein secretion system component Hcp